MSQVTIHINAKPYHLACDAGQEGHVGELARFFDGKVRELARHVGQAPEHMLFLMASLEIIDQLAEYEREIEMLRRQANQAGQDASQHKSETKKQEAAAREALLQVAQKLEHTAKELDEMMA